MVNDKDKDLKKEKEKLEKDKRSAEKAEKAAMAVKLLASSEDISYPTFTSTSSKPDGDLARGGVVNLRKRFARLLYLRTGTLGSLGTLARTVTGVPGGASSLDMTSVIIDTCRLLGEESINLNLMRILPLFHLHGGGGRVPLRDPAPRSLIMDPSSWALLEGGGRKIRLPFCHQLRRVRRWNKWRRRVAPLTL